MRGDEDVQGGMFSYVTMEQRIASDHPARCIRRLVHAALKRMDAALSKLYSTMGRPSIAPERRRQAQLLMVLYSVRSERRLMEQLNYNCCSADSHPSDEDLSPGARSSWAWR